ncbi:MAG: DUF1840 domain-containing protein [Pseudomonadota bacterium]|nr:DUF1840 domain-containing protein [Pseudomonadota bacterium]
MLVTFKSEAYADIIMFGDIARRLLKMMGHSGTIPSAILAADVPAALDRLKHAIEVEKSTAEVEKSTAASEVPPHPQDKKMENQAVSLAYRALPLIELLAAAAQKKCDVMWKQM